MARLIIAAETYDANKPYPHLEKLKDVEYGMQSIIEHYGGYQIGNEKTGIPHWLDKGKVFELQDGCVKFYSAFPPMSDTFQAMVMITGKPDLWRPKAPLPRDIYSVLKIHNDMEILRNEIHMDTGVGYVKGARLSDEMARKGKEIYSDW